MSEIPEDVMVAAIAAVTQDDWTVDGDAAYTDPGDSVIASIKILPIARAIFAERERSRTALSEAEQRVKDARLQTQAMHRRAQESERVEQMIFDTLGTWFRLYNEGRFKPRAKRALFFVVLKELKARAEKIRGRRALTPSEPHDAEGREKPRRGDPSIFDDAEGRN